MKKLKKNEFSYENSYVRLASVTPCNPQHYVALTGNDKWENLRYVLEKQMGCFKFTLPMKVTQNSFLSAVFQFSVTGVPRGSVVSGKTQVYSGDIIIVTRQPQPKHLHAYIPPKYWCDLGYDNSCGTPTSAKAPPASAGTPPSSTSQTEEERLQALVSQSTLDDTQCFLPPIVVRMLRQHIMHPTDYATLTTPHPLFVCQYCGNQGKHFHTLCPFIEADARNNSTELVTKVRRLVGIPKSRLRPATPEEVSQGQYYLNENNEKVVKLKKQEVFSATVDSEMGKPDIKVKVSDTLGAVADSSVGTHAKPTPKKGVEYDPALDQVIVLDQGVYESKLQFDFEDYLVEQDRLEQQREEEFYKAHPELRKKKNQICTHYYRGMCHKGKLECEFLHTGDENYIAICQFYVNDQCTDANCMFRHPDKTVFNNTCNAYKRGFCDKGKQCKYKHVKFRHPSDNTELTPEVCKAMVLALATRKRRR